MPHAGAAGGVAFTHGKPRPRRTSVRAVSVDSALIGYLDAAARFGVDGDGVTRFAWSPEIAAVSRWLVDELEAIGLDAEIDAAGNVVGRWNAGAGTAVAVGSHLDTVPRGGRFDGALGVISGLEAIRRLKTSGFVPSRPVWLVSFTDEEGARFRTSMLGSRAFVGEPLDELADRRDAEGTTVRDAMAMAGFDFARLPEARAIDGVGAYLELHIEQGRVLERAGASVGVVTGLAGILGVRATLSGRADHAGTTPMNDRRDALAGAARAVLEVRQMAASDPSLVRATVGTIAVEPGGFNVIPARCEFSVDLRATGSQAFEDAERRVTGLLERIAEEEGLGLELRTFHRQPPHDFDPGIVDALRAAVRDERIAGVELASGAGHDAMVLGRQVPAGMLFVPSRDGLSHTPDEYTAPEHCEAGVRVLARAIAGLGAAA
jgi:allantoate deiminase